MTDKLTRKGPARFGYAWRSLEPISAANPTVAARCRNLEIVSDDPRVLEGLELFPGLYGVEVHVPGDLDLAPLRAALPELDAVSVTVGGRLRSIEVLADLSLRTLSLRASAERLPGVVAETDWSQLPAGVGLGLECTDRRGCLVDLAPLHAVRGLTDLHGHRVVFEPRDVDARGFHEAVPPLVTRFVSAWVDDRDRDRIRGAGLLRADPSTPEWSDFWEGVRVTLTDEPLPLPWEPLDDELLLDLDVVELLDIDTDAGDPNYLAERRLRKALSAADVERIAFDTTAEALNLQLPADDPELQGRVDVALRGVLDALARRYGSDD